MQTSKLVSGGEVIVTRLEIADSFNRRFFGLMGRQKIDVDYGLFFPNCNSIHSLFMKTRFDLIFTDNEMVVKEIFENVKPWKVLSSKMSKHCIELASGRIATAGIVVGQSLEII